MSKFIALVATAVILNGVRTVIQPGEELPQLNKHDEKELLTSGAAMDPEKQVASEEARKQEETAAMQNFQQAPEQVQAVQESTTAEPSVDGDAAADTTKPKPTAKTAAGKK